MEGPVHRLNINGVLFYIDDEELSYSQHLLYWCGSCNAYHLRPWKTEAQLAEAIEQEEVQS